VQTPITKPTQPRADAFTVLAHWWLVISLAISFVSGMRISGDQPAHAAAQFLARYLPSGAVHEWHSWSALALLAVAAGYAAFLFVARLSPRVRFDATRRAAFHSPDRKAALSAWNVLVYWLGFLLLAVAGATGALMYFAPRLPAIDILTTVHRVAAWSFLVYLVLHVVSQLALGGWRQLLKIALPRAAYLGAVPVAAVVMGGTAVALFAADRNTGDELTIQRVATPPVIDGNTSDPVWSAVPAVHIATTRGANLPDGAVTVDVRAVHDGQMLYMLFEWDDATRSAKHLPLVKTATGWAVKQTEYDIEDEDDYYEDKFGVMLARTAQIGGGATHLGPKPLADKPAALGGRGLHYTSDGSIVDAWHWKGVRSGNALMNQIDDNYFGPPMEAKPGAKRYTGGYTQDPKTGSGGFQMNWVKYSSSAPVTPLRLPKNPAVLEPYRTTSLDPKVSDTLDYWLAFEDTVPYSPELDTYPVGTVMPSVLVDGPFGGDRGDVKAVGRWANGRWRMEVSRRLDTGSKFDVPIVAGVPVYMSLAVFDHSQTRHSQNLRPVQLLLGN
jgi:cytochrome b subunit of formate dehydrogenase